MEDMDVLCYSIVGGATVYASKIDKRLSQGTETLLAVLRGNKEPLPPILYFCSPSGCLLTGDTLSDNHTTSTVCIWKLYSDLTTKLDINPPWMMHPVKILKCGLGSILSMTYLPKSQLIVTSGKDSIIRFWDPLGQQVRSAKPKQTRIKPGYYK